ncbi:LLM class flavin-dependent oxidoreductase [Actinomadura sp. KC06]|uniref:LLM class flavin-dependent oxidoreductase n=1 Tax=Actinomadura sp. KC06 TaxID=2530369 RepID=UPI00105334EA|nr:LLM class flavin-dependent oxidoreductase [Actinomadura sp. KC06]TDD29258.1 LLM class flavin-dependent oxidoreductase [Actinomadura sp. KC06]
MDIGIGLPATIPGTPGTQIMQWAKTAEERGFSTLGVIDRLVYGNCEPLVTLAAAAAVTERIRLMTSILLVPFRANAALLAKQAATVNHLSGGRLVLGMAVGGYEDDYAASGVPFAGRGRRFDAMLDEMTSIWAGEPRGVAGAIGPQPGVPPERLIFGGHGERPFARVAARGAGWIAGSRGVETFQQGAHAVREAWTRHGRDGDPRLMAQPYFSLGPHAQADAESFLTDHYAVEGWDAQKVASLALTDTTSVRKAVAAYKDAGCDELILFPCNPDPHQVELLADAVL